MRANQELSSVFIVAKSGFITERLAKWIMDMENIHYQRQNKHLWYKGSAFRFERNECRFESYRVYLWKGNGHMCYFAVN